MTSHSRIAIETAKASLIEILDALESPENIGKLNEAKENSGNEMLKMMQFLFPLVTKIQMEVISNYGYAEGREGILKYSQLIRAAERENAEVARLHSRLRSYFLPPVLGSPSAEASL